MKIHWLALIAYWTGQRNSRELEDGQIKISQGQIEKFGKNKSSLSDPGTYGTISSNLSYTLFESLKEKREKMGEEKYLNK